MKLNLKDRQKCGIYCITNNVNGKKYVGKSKNIYIRMKDHITLLNNKSKDENPHLINSWHKYGKQNFSYSVLEYIENDENLSEMLYERELFWIRELDTLNREIGYNLRLDSETGCIVSDETRLKQSVSGKIRAESISNYSEIMSIQSNKFWKNASENELKEHSKRTAIGIRKYRVAKCDYKSGEILEIFETPTEVLDKYPDFYLQAIKGCCSGTKKSYKASVLSESSSLFSVFHSSFSL